MNGERKPNTALRHQRDLRGWSQRKVADEVGTSADVVSRWERGDRLPDPYFRERLCTLFGKNAEELRLIPSTQTDTGSTSVNIPLYDILSPYLRRQKDHVLATIAPGSTTLRVKEIIERDDLFIPLPWKTWQEDSSSVDIADYLVENVLNGQRVLLLGDAGQGKTTILKHVFAHLVDLFLEKFNPSRMALPLFVPLREFSSFSGNPIDLLWTHVGDDFPLNYDEFTGLVHDKQIVFLFDAFDEIKGKVTQRLINERSTSKIFLHQSILTCRKSFFETYLAMTPLQDHYQQSIELQPLSLNQDVIHYVSCFCQQKQEGRTKTRFSSPTKVIEAIQMSQELQDLAQRPLLLFMILEVFTSLKQDWHKEKWSVTMLYRRYTELWLKNEASKPDSVLKWNEKVSLLQEIAWFTYRGKSTQHFGQHANQQTAFTHEELSRFVHNVANRYHIGTEVEILDDLCFRSLLELSEEEHYVFIHNSFQEYYVARYILSCMGYHEESDQALPIIEQVLQVSLPFDVATFLKEMLKDATPYEKEIIAANLMSAYEHNRAEDEKSTIIRQQAGHYLASLGTKSAIQFLEHVWQGEPNKWVQRSILVGLALYSGRMDMLERYIQIIRSDPEAADINIRYHLVYYDHQADSLFSSQRLKVEQCEKTVAALFRHLKDERYKNGWSLDMLTLSTLITLRDTFIINTQPWYWPFLSEFLERDYPELGTTCQQEKDHLKNLFS